MNKPYIIGITGSSGSGKTYVSKMIKNTIKNPIVIISMDNFYKGLNDVEKENVEEYNFDDLNALDLELFIECINKLKQGLEVEIPTYDFKTHKRGKEKILIKPLNVIIIEGILIFNNNELRNLFDFKVYIDAKISTVIFRRLERDLLERERDFKSIKTQYIKFVQPSYEKYIKPIKKFCDLVIPNEDDTNFIGIKMLCDIINHKYNLFYL